MAADTYNDQKKNEQKAMALLTLAADKVEVRNVCLSDEEMAALVDGAEKEMVDILTHLGVCDKCYREWLSLKRNKCQATPRGRLCFLNSFGNIRYIGTALAAAACIAVYLNVVTMEEKVILQKEAPRAILPQSEDLAIPPTMPSAVMREKEEPTRVTEGTPALSPVPPPAAPPTAVGSGSAKGKLEPLQQIPKPSMLKPQEVVQKRAFTLGQAEKKMVQDTESDAALPLAESSIALATSPPVREDGKLFLAELRAACLAGRVESQFWADMVAQGLRLQALSAGTQPWPEEEKLSAVLVLAQGINGPDTVPRQCRLILDELAKKSGSK